MSGDGNFPRGCAVGLLLAALLWTAAAVAVLWWLR